MLAEQVKGCVNCYEMVTQQKKIWNKMLHLLALMFGYCAGFQLVDLPNVSVIKSAAEKCTENTDLVLIVHSAPKNAELRQAIRQSWGSSIPRIFVVASSSPDSSSDDQFLISQESAKYQDIFQPNFTDSYRNLTYKHLAGYW